MIPVGCFVEGFVNGLLGRGAMGMTGGRVEASGKDWIVVRDDQGRIWCGDWADRQFNYPADLDFGNEETNAIVKRLYAGT